MRAFSRIAKAHATLDAYLAFHEATARGRTERDMWAHTREINDHAFFVLLFAQFEQAVESKYSRLVDRKKRLRSWKLRAVWEEIDAERISFMQKVAVLAAKGGRVYNDIHYLYSVRCDIAHGKRHVGPIALSVEIGKLRSLVKSLRTS